MADLDKIDNDILNELMSDPKTVTPPEEITEDVKPLMLDEVDEDIFKEQVANNPPPMLVQSVEAGKTKDPDAFAEAKRLSRATGIPVEAVESDVPRAKAIEAPEYDISKSWNDNPAVAQWMSDPNNAGVAHDITEDLAKIEDKLKPEKPGAVSNAARNTAKRAVDLSKNFLGFVTSLGKPVIASRLEDLQSEDRLSAFAAGEEYKPLATAEGPDFKIDENRPIKILNSVNKKLTSDFGYIPENTWETTKKAFADNGAVSADAWGELLAYSFESGAASLVDMGAMVAAMPVYIASRTKEMGDERAKNKGMPEATPQEMGEAMPFVLGSIILDKLSLGKMLGVGKGAAEEVGKEALKHVVKKGAAAVGTEMTTEFIQEGVIEYIGEKYGTDAKMSFAEAADRGLGGAVAAGPMSAVMSGTAGVINSGVLEKKQKTSQEKFTEKTNAAIQEYTDEQQKLDEIIELSQGIVNRDPVAANELFGLVQEKYEIEDIHIDGAEFVSVMDELGIDPNDATYAAAFESAMDESTGRDVTLTLGEYMTNYANLEPLRPHVRLSADGLSQNELITAPAERDNVLSRMVNESQQNVEEAAASKEIYESVKTQLFDAGVLTGKEAGLAASIFPAMMQQHATKRGITIQEAYETIPGITISSDNVKPLPEVTLSQAKEQGYEGDDIAEASEWSQAVDKFGDEGMTQEARMQRAQEQGYDTETVYYHGTDADVEAFELPSDSKTAGSGIFLTTDSDKAQTYTGPRGGNISPVVVKSDNILELDANGENWNEIEIDNLFIDGRPISDLVEEMEEGDYTTTDELAMIVKSMGYDGLKLQNVKDKGVNTQLYDAVEYLQEQGISVPTRPDGSYDFADIDSDVFAEARQYAEGVGGGASDTTVIFDPSNIRSVNAAFDPEQSDSANLLAQTAYHGSPHKFDKFSVDSMGAGEGAQAYGWGLYFAEEKKVAEHYRDELSDGISFGSSNIPPVLSIHIARDLPRKKSEVIDIIDKKILPHKAMGKPTKYKGLNPERYEVKSTPSGKTHILVIGDKEYDRSSSFRELEIKAAKYNDNLQFKEGLKDGSISVTEPKGEMYTVDIPEDSELINWDVKMIDQAPEVLSRIGSNFKKEETGEEFYRRITSKKKSPKAASEFLQSIGIKGLYYLDQNSRTSSANATRNFVIWDDSAIKNESTPELNQSPVDESSDPEENLYVAHNLSEENLLHVDELGGLAAPSIAIARVDKGDFESFGGITLIADPEIAVSNKAKAFDADVYSPRHPQATYTLDRQAKREYENEIGRLPDRFTEYGTPELVRNDEFIDYYLDKVGATPKSFQAKVSPEVKAGVKLLAKHRTVYDLKSDPKFIKLAEKLGQANYDSYVSGMDDLVARKKRISEIKKRDFNEADYIEQEKDFAKDTFMGESAIDSLADQVHKHSQKGGIDTVRLADDKRKRMKQKKHKDGIQAEAKEWADKLISGKQMFAGYTPGGGRKYKPYNLENIVKEMTKGLQGEENFFYGVGNVRAKHAKQYKSVAGMAADRDRIVSAEEMETIKEESNAKFIEIVEKLKPFYKYDAEGFGFTDDVGNAIADNNYQDFNLTADAKKDIAEFIGYLKSLPTQYFESKIQRAVDLSEFHTAIVPNGTGKEAINILKRKGLIVKKYKDSETKEKAIRATGKLFQEKRASVGYTGTDYMVNLGKQSDRSSFLHEAGHIFLDIERVFAEKYGVTNEQQNWLTHLGAESFDDIDFFKWADVQRRVNAGDTSLLDEHGLTNDELTAKVDAARDSHEQFAEEFETYLMEGKAPSVSLRNAFRAFKDWLVAVYRGMKVNNITLSRDVKGMFDRLFASEEEIAAMQAVYGFDDSTKESGKAKAKETLESKIFKQWKRQTEKWWKDETKAEIEERIATLKDTRTYSAETWLSENKVNAQQAGEALGYREEKVSKSDDVDPSVDSISIAVAKLGGIDRDEAEGHGIDPATWKGKLNNNSPVFGKPIFRKEGGDSFDGMATRIAQYGYTDDPHLLIELIDQDMNGDPQYSNEVDFDLLFAKAEDQEALIPMPKRLYGLTAADGMDIDLAANQLGYKSGDEMLRDIAASRPIAMQASNEATTFMLDKYGDILNDGTLEEEARLAVHNEEQGKQLLVELRAMNNQNKKPTLINRDMLKRAAEDAIDSLKVKDIKPEKYHRAEVKAAQEVVRHQANGDTEMAIQEKTNQLLNFYLYREALKAKTNTDRWRKHNQGVKTRKYSAGSVNGEYINQMKVYAAAFDFRKSPDPKAINDLRGLALWIQAQKDTNPEGYRPQFYHQVLADLANPAINTDDITLQSYSDMTVGELRSAFETLQHLRYIGGKLSENDKAQAKLEADTVTASINANAGEDKPRNKHGRKGGGFKRGVADFGWSQARAFLHIQEFDGWKKDAANGVLYKAIWQKMLDASDINVALKMDMAAKVKDVLNVDRLKQKTMKTFTGVDGTDFSLELSERVMFAVYWGSPESRQSLLETSADGREISLAEANRILDSLTDEDIKIVEGIWKLNDSLKDRMFQTQRDVHGVAPKAVEAMPFTIRGKVLSGGYQKIRYEWDPKDTAGREDTMTEALQGISNAGVSMTKAGSMNERVGSGGRQISLNIGNVTQALEESVQFISFARTSVEVHKIMNNSGVKSAIVNKYGMERYRAFLDSLNGTFAGDVVGQTGGAGIAKFMRKTRSNMSMAMLMFSIRNIVQQFVGGTNLMVELKMKDYFSASGDFMSDRDKWVSFVNDKSPMMRYRMALTNKEVSDAAIGLEASATNSWLVDRGYLAQTLIDKAISMPAWLAGYRKGLGLYNDEKLAAQYADEIVVSAMGSGQAKDLAPMFSGAGQGGNQLAVEAMKQLAFMGSFFNMVGQIYYKAYKTNNLKTAEGIGEFSRQISWTLIIPAIVSALVVDDIPDEEDPIAWAAKKIASYGLGSVMLVREIAGVWTTGFSPSQPISNTLKAASQLVSTPAQVMLGEKEMDSKAAISLLRDVTPFIPLPGSYQAARTMQGLMDDEQDLYGALVEGKERNK